MYPLTFRPIFKDRVWGGRALEQLFKKSLPPNIPIGESWEISDRPGDESVITNGEFAGKTLHWLMEHRRQELLGDAKATPENRFPLLIKILDAQEKLSLQVHPPAHKAAELRGEPKTEMWYIAQAAPGAELYVGLKRGVTREEFEGKVQTGEVADCFHRVPVKAGDTMFLPSGRVHAIGAGLVIFEIQQNSDTTYRVFDWHRVGLDGKPRELHIAQSLSSIDFNDFAPALVNNPFVASGAMEVKPLVRHSLFNVDLCRVKSHEPITIGESRMKIIAALNNPVVVHGNGTLVRLQPGEFSLIPAALKSVQLSASPGSSFLSAECGK